MANISREDDLKDLAERTANGGNRPHGKTFPGNGRARAYNALHGTSVEDDDVLDRILGAGK